MDTIRLLADQIPGAEIVPIIGAFRRMCRALEFDLCEMAITTYLTAKAYNKPFTALPVFIMRQFHHAPIVYNTKSGVKSPQDLEGRKVGVNRGYTVTTGLWARSILQEEHGVDLSKVTWVLSGDEHVAEYVPPSNVVPLGRGTTLADALGSGELAAVIGLDKMDHPDVRPLIANARDAGLAALGERGHYPINHLIVVKDELLDAHPELAADVFDAFARGSPTQAPGAGLGLTIVKAIADAHDAEIDVRTRPGHGTRFSVTFAVAG